MNKNKQGSISIKEFFSNFSLEISDYQRPYVWSAQQVINLLDDLHNFSSVTNNQPDYYLDNIILVVKKTESNTTSYQLIDGQQRIISLTIIAILLGEDFSTESIKINSQNSQDRIQENTSYLKHYTDSKQFSVNWDRINITYIIADNDDQAFKFYTTLSTSGKRLNGIDIIKPYHLQATDKSQQELKAVELEKYQFDSNKLNNIVHILLRARYWQGATFLTFPYIDNVNLWKTKLEQEFVTNTRENLEDTKYFKGYQVNNNDLISNTPNYYIDQPLNKGINTINYLLYFCQVWDLIITQLEELKLNNIIEVESSRGKTFNNEYFQIALLTYVSRYGKNSMFAENFERIVKLLFKVCFYNRLVYPVNKSTVYKVESENRLINQIAYSYDKLDLIAFCENYYQESILSQFSKIKEKGFENYPMLKRFSEAFKVDEKNIVNPFFN